MQTHDHPLLAKILAGVSSTGSHNHHWGQLRREVFPGEDSWAQLKAWAAGHKLDCALAFSQSSKGTEVQFLKLGKGGKVEPPPASLAPVAAAEEAEEVDELDEDEAEERGDEAPEEAEEAV
jgi:hypothetical protein